MKHLFRLFFEITILPWFQLHYRVRRYGTEHVPHEGGVLLLPNHVSYVDSFLIYLTCPRKVRFVIVEHYMEKPFAFFLKLFRAIPIDRSSPRDAIVKTVDALQAGDVVCLFAEGGLTRTGVTNDLKKGFELIARRSGCPVVPCYMDGLWGSIFSGERGRYIWKLPRGLSCPFQVVYGKPVPGKEATVERVFEGILEASVEAFAARREFEKPLESAVIESLKTRVGRNLTLEYGKKARRWSRSQFLGLAMAVARRWINSPPDDRERIGVLLPPGPTPAVLNLGLFLAGKTPVNLPFDLEPVGLEKVAMQMEKLGVRTVITSKAFMPNLVDFWRGDEGRFIDIATELTAPGRFTLSLESFFARFEPSWLTKWRLEINQRDPQREAVGLIDSPGEDAVLLTSLQLFRNARQVAAADFVRERDAILSEIPMSSIPGQLFQLWTPIFNYGRTVSRSFSMRSDNRLLRALCEGQEVDLLAGDSEFYREIDRALDLPKLRCGFVFDHDLDWDDLSVREEFLKLPLVPGWRSHGRVVAMSLPDEPDPLPAGLLSQMCRKHGTGGRFLPGIAGRNRGGQFFFLYDPPGRASERADWVPAGERFGIDEEGFLAIDAPEKSA